MENDARRIPDSEIWSVLADTKPASHIARQAIMDAQDVRLVMGIVRRMNESIMFDVEDD